MRFNIIMKAAAFNIQGMEEILQLPQPIIPFFPLETYSMHEASMITGDTPCCYRLPGHHMLLQVTADYPKLLQVTQSYYRLPGCIAKHSWLQVTGN